MEAAPHPWPALGVLLMRDGLVTKHDLQAILDEQLDARQQRISGRRLGEIVVERRLVTQDQVARLVAEQYELPFVDLDVADIDVEVAVLLNEELSRRMSAIPIGVRPDGSYLLAIGDPSTVVFSDELRRVLGAPPRFVVVGPDALESAIASVHAHTESPEEHTSEFRFEAGSHDSLVVEPPRSGDTRPAAAAGAERYLGSQRAVAHLWPPLGALLIREGLIDDEELETSLAQQRLSSSRRLGEILVDRGAVTRTDVARLVAEQYELPFVDVEGSEIDPAAAALLPEEVAKKHSALPVGFLPDGSLRVVIADPSTVLYSDELQFALGIPLSFAMATPDAIDAALASFYGRASIADEAPENAAAVDEPADPDPPVEHVEPVSPVSEELAEVFHLDQALALGESEAEADAVDTEADAAIEPETSMEEDIGVGSAVGVLQSIGEVPAVDEPDASATESPELAADELEGWLERALEPGVTALHFSPQPTGLLSRARVDGVMRELETLPTSAQASVRDRLTETTQLSVGQRTVDVRVEVLQTKEGEKLTLHVLLPDDAPSALADLGMAPESEEMVRTALDTPLGAILFCGPARSGTTTTLHAALRALNTPDRQLTMIENPVQRAIAGIDHVEVDPSAGLTFTRGLRTVFRSDSDVVGVDDIRGKEAAQLVIEAAMTAGLVLATVPARTAVTATRRLVEMGVDPRLLGSALGGVVAQRLARRVCSQCRESYYATPDELAELGRPAEEASRRLLARGRGCPTCGGTGYRGRVGIFEILPLTDEIRKLVASGGSTAEIQAVAVAAGMRTLRDDGIRLCLEGVTTAAEVKRVLGGPGRVGEDLWVRDPRAAATTGPA